MARRRALILQTMTQLMSLQTPQWTSTGSQGHGPTNTARSTDFTRLPARSILCAHPTWSMTTGQLCVLEALKVSPLERKNIDQWPSQPQSTKVESVLLRKRSSLPMVVKIPGDGQHNRSLSQSSVKSLFSQTVRTAVTALNCTHPVRTMPKNS